jgi:serine/threonine-protein kinase
MNKRWIWLGRYLVVIVLALILAAVFGEMELFKTTRFGKSGFNAARVAQFLGYGGALLVMWLLARRAARTMAGEDERWNLVRSITVPLATLIVVACAHSVLLLVLGPVMNKAWMPTYNWLFIGGIILSAAWLVAALFTGSSTLEPLFGSARAGRRREHVEQRA